MAIEKVRVVDHGGSVVECMVNEFDVADLCKYVTLRWPNFAVLHEFDLAHGARCVPRTMDYKWRIHPEDLDALREQAKEMGKKVPFKSKPPSLTTERKLRTRRPTKPSPRQGELFK